MTEIAADAPPVFLYGTLRDDALRAIVVGDGPSGVPAVLEDHRVVALAGGAWPALVAGPGAVAEGLLVPLAPEARARGDYYEGLFGYVRRPLTVRGASGEVAAEVWLPRETPAHDGTPWDLEAWQARHGAVSRRAAEAALALRGQRDPAETAGRWGMIRARAQARLNAEAACVPATLRRAAVPGDVEVAAQRTPYAFFFAVEEYDLRFRRFDGTMSQTVTRAAFVSADAVTVLPYDPARDRVLLIEQFRPGPFARGDANPWSLEAIAGRTDAGESPEETARREAREEAGLELGRLIRLAGYYPSPGAKAEYLHSYIGLADLPDSAAGLGGLASEAEDIRSHVVPFDRLMDLVATGEVTNGPLLFSALELERRRAALRAA